MLTWNPVAVLLEVTNRNPSLAAIWLAVSSLIGSMAASAAEAAASDADAADADAAAAADALGPMQRA